jgi:hypothetical protein
MGAAGSGRAAADREPAGKLGLSGGGERRPFLVADADPFNIAVTDGICERIKRVANQAEYVRDADLFERANFDRYDFASCQPR